MQYCSLHHRTLLLSPVASTTGYCFCFVSIPSFFLELFLHWPPVTYWASSNLGHSFFSILSICLLILFMGSQGKNTEVVCQSLLQWATFCQTSPPWPVHLGWPHMAWLIFIESDKTVVHVIRLASFLWLLFQCVCPLVPSCHTYRLIWVSLSLDVGYLFTAAPAKRSRCSLPWMRGVSSRLSLLTQASCTRAAATSWMWAAPLGHCPLSKGQWVNIYTDSKYAI